MSAAVRGGGSGFESAATYEPGDPLAELAPALRNVDSAFERYRARKLLEVYLPAKEDRVLDLACGRGVYSLVVAPRVREVVGVGREEAGVSRFRRRAADLSARNVRFLRASPESTGLESESFDVVVAAGLVERTGADGTARVLDECTRLLKRGGRLVLWTSYGGHLVERLRARGLLPGSGSEAGELHHKSIEELRRLLLDRGFSIQKSYYVESHVPLLRRIESTLMSSVPLLRRRIALLARRR